MNFPAMTYLRPATKARDGYDGFLYFQSWGCGWQYLVFPSHEAAAKHT